MYILRLVRSPRLAAPILLLLLLSTLINLSTNFVLIPSPPPQLHSLLPQSTSPCASSSPPRPQRAHTILYSKKKSNSSDKRKRFSNKRQYYKLQTADQSPNNKIQTNSSTTSSTVADNNNNKPSNPFNKTLSKITLTPPRRKKKSSLRPKNSTLDDDEDLPFSSTLDPGEPRQAREIEREEEYKQRPTQLYPTTAKFSRSASKNATTTKLYRKGMDMIVNGRPILANPPRTVISVQYNLTAPTFREIMNYTSSYLSDIELHCTEKVCNKRLLSYRLQFLSGNLTKTSYSNKVTQLIETNRHPKIIVIGDVHGCVDELRSLLRRCNYLPGDLIIFLGDLVSKGPHSKSVIQLARNLNCLSVRGNHDFEVVRWSQAIKNGAEAPIFQTEHYCIAKELKEKDVEYMESLPWYISCPSLNSLFVHAGFVSGVRLRRQNPRLMMNMRSILPDGTVTSKFFENWPWARLWDGPQTVFFGHDADRGLQQYENAVGLDTGVVYGGRLTACVLPEKKMVSVSARKAYFMYRRKRYT